MMQCKNSWILVVVEKQSMEIIENGKVKPKG